jgi:UTP--glucose-1-phosphate uridylyltransferase
MAAQALKNALPTHLKPGNGGDDEAFAGKHHGKTRSHMAFENTSTNIAAAQMRNALTQLAETVKDADQKKASQDHELGRHGIRTF